MTPRGHDPDCLLIDKNHDGPHHVRPDHPALKGKANVYHCSICHYSLWDPTYADIEAHVLDEHANGVTSERFAIDGNGPQ